MTHPLIYAFIRSFVHPFVRMGVGNASSSKNNHGIYSPNLLNPELLDQPHLRNSTRILAHRDLCDYQVQSDTGEPIIQKGFAPTAVDYARASSALARHDGV